MVVVARTEVLLVSDFRYRLQAAALEAPEARFIETSEQPAPSLAPTLGRGRGRVGIEPDHLTWSSGSGLGR